MIEAGEILDKRIKSIKRKTRNLPIEKVAVLAGLDVVNEFLSNEGASSTEANDESSEATEEKWLGNDGEPLSWLTATSTISSIGVPGTPALLWDGHQRFGRLPWAKNFEQSISLAREGFIPSPRLIKSISLARQIGVGHSQAFQSLYLPNGKLLSGKIVLNIDNKIKITIILI